MQVHLNGGPLHDRYVALEPGTECFTVEQPLVWPAKLDDIMHQNYDTVPTRVGHYSKTTYRGEFEWDGWRPHENE